MHFRKFDFLSTEFALGLNWIPDRQNPGFTAFLVCFVRAALLSLLAALVFYSVDFAVEDIRHLSTSQIAAFMLVHVFFEEQARWIFASSAERPARACFIFWIAIIGIESIGFRISSSGSLFEFASLRFGSILVHSFSALLCFASTKWPFPKKLSFFALALIFHMCMNMGGSEKLGLYLISVFSLTQHWSI